MKKKKKCIIFICRICEEFRLMQVQLISPVTNTQEIVEMTSVLNNVSTSNNRFKVYHAYLRNKKNMHQELG